MHPLKFSHEPAFMSYMFTRKTELLVSVLQQVLQIMYIAAPAAGLARKH